MMGRIVRALLLIAALALTFVIAGGVLQSHAATGGSVVQFGTDATLTSSATGVTSTQAFPDGNTKADCFILVDTKGAETNKYGNCANYNVTVTCGSVPFQQDLVAPDSGAAVKIDGTEYWRGQYDTGPSCTTVPNVKANLSADVTGLTAGQSVVAFINNDNKASRDGCWAWTDSVATSSSACFANTNPGNNGAYVEAGAGAATATIYEYNGAAAPGSSGNLTLGGVFIEAVGAAAAPTNTPGGAPTATATPLPTSTPIPAVSIGSAVSQFSTDPTLTGSSLGVISSQAFPDGGAGAGCFVQITSKSGVQSGTTGSCAGVTVTVTCSSFQFAATPTTDQHGAALVIGGARTQAGGYDTGPSCTTLPGTPATLTYTVSGITAGTKLVSYWNNDPGNASRDGCVGFAGTSGHASQACIANTLAGSNGAFYEVAADGTSGTFYQVAGKTGVGKSGNLTAGGVFIGATGGTPLSASLVTVSRVHGLARIHWFASGAGKGFNVFNGSTQLNRRLVTSHTNSYHFNTRHAINHLRIVAVTS